MNRYILHTLRPTPTIAVGQIWRGKYQESEPRLIRVFDKSISDLWVVADNEYPQPQANVCFHVTSNDILSEYYLNE